jgi:NADH:ubiquinone oxidoreductase subunit
VPDFIWSQTLEYCNRFCVFIGRPRLNIVYSNIRHEGGAIRASASSLDQIASKCDIMGRGVILFRSCAGMTTAITLFTTWLKGEQVGEDHLGNKYYHERKAPAKGRRRRRWVIYNGEDEASRVPPEWHAWLHYTVDEIAVDAGRPHQDWQQEHLPNLTGTGLAYRPPGHTLAGGRRDKATGDYEAWAPE